MFLYILIGIFLPLVGTALGSCAVFALKKERMGKARLLLSGFAAGVMLAASIWSLILPALEFALDWHMLSFVPVLVGLWCGIVFLIASDRFLRTRIKYQPKFLSRSTSMTVFAVVLHNIPEGMAVGVALAGAENLGELLPGLVLSFGIAVQNIPEGAIISMPLCSENKTKPHAFWMGTLSGIVEPVAAVLSLLAVKLAVPLMPYMLSFAAGAMIYVCIDELIPAASVSDNKQGIISFAVGFSIMMALDVMLG